eukprot:XP_011667775.1 PREDICTED: uncharacterized protein LOC105439909 [Strongylocentrotus purpuratus]
MKLTICFIISVILFTPTLGYLLRHDIPWHGGSGFTVSHLSISFGDFGCNVPSSSFTGNKKKKFKRDVDLGKWKWKHSMVYFRGKTYEFSYNNVYFREGGIGRTNPLSCPGVKRSNAGRSRCTSSQATELARWYQRNNRYNFIYNNCHYFAEFLINRLLDNECDGYGLWWMNG